MMCEQFFLLFIKDKLKDSNEIGPSVMEITLKIIFPCVLHQCVLNIVSGVLKGVMNLKGWLRVVFQLLNRCMYILSQWTELHSVMIKFFII